MPRREIEISTNIIQGGPNVPIEDIAILDNEGFMHGGDFATLIKPEHLESYIVTVRRLMSNIVDTPPAQSPSLLDAGEPSLTMFDFNDAASMDGGEKVGRLFVPRIARKFLPELGDDPNNYLTWFHGKLIDHTNFALERVMSPLRLAPLPLGAARPWERNTQ